MALASDVRLCYCRKFCATVFARCCAVTSYWVNFAACIAVREYEDAMFNIRYIGYETNSISYFVFYI